MDMQVFDGVMPAPMAPCPVDRTPALEARAERSQKRIAAAMSALSDCRAMGDWPLHSADGVPL